MKRYETLILLAMSFLLLANISAANYWFQSGVSGGSDSSSNYGAAVEIETIMQQRLGAGALGFWVGENLPNGAFLQVGYLVENQTGYYPTECTISGCASTRHLTAGNATWFYEYFPVGESALFLGSIGPDKSAGINGTFNTYSFYSLGNTWYFQFNNKTIGSADLGASNSGPYTPLAIGELANATSTDVYIKPVTFSNLSAYKYDMIIPVQSAYGVIDYGVSSDTTLDNPYGVQEIGNRINYFEVGSGLPLDLDGKKLWSLGYQLKVTSPYGNINSKNSYEAYSTIGISAPPDVYLSNSTRAVFTGWAGTGLGSYTGPRNSISITLNRNITEAANWQIQYFVNVTSHYGSTEGSGWYASGTTASYSLDSTSVYQSGTERFRFLEWSNGNKALTGNMTVNAPLNITALWQYKVKINGENAYGKLINTSTFLINGKQMNSTPFLNISGRYDIEGGYYKGLLLAANYSVPEGSAPSEISVPLPVYNVTIKTIDFFGYPVNASAEVIYKNDTGEVLFSGNEGMLRMSNVPYGYASVTLSSLGSKQELITSGGSTATVFFLSQSNVAVSGLVLLIVAYVAYGLIRHKQNKREVQNTSEVKAEA